MPEHIHLRDFLATGDFFGFDGTSTRADVESRLGQADYDGLVSRKHKLPRIWVYGGIELTFGYDADSPLELIHFDHPNLPPPGSASLAIEPWVLREHASVDAIADACRDAGIAFTLNDQSPVPHWTTSGNVQLTFHDDPPDSGLAAVSLVLRDGDR